jgi:hypothetical protein
MQQNNRLALVRKLRDTFPFYSWGMRVAIVLGIVSIILKACAAKVQT